MSQEFFIWLRDRPGFHMLLGDLRARFGGELVSALQSTHILVPGKINCLELPCGHSEHLPCRRRIRYSRASVPVGLCENPGNLCANRPIYPDQLNPWCLNLEHFATTLQRLLQLKGAVCAEPWWHDSKGFYYLGYREMASHQEDFYVVFRPHLASFKALMAMLSNKSSDVWVIIPTWHGIPDDLRLAYGPEMHTTLLAMTDIIGVSLASFKLLCPLRKAITRPFQEDAPPSKATCVVYSHNNPTVPQPLNEAEYAELLQNVGQFHMVLNMLMFTERQGYGAWVAYNGPPQKIRIPHSEGLALREVILAAGRPLKTHEFKDIPSCARRDKLIERARQKIDIRQKDRPLEQTWRVIQTIHADSLRDKAYVFSPAPGLRWCLICPA